MSPLPIVTGWAPPEQDTSTTEADDVFPYQLPELQYPPESSETAQSASPSSSSDSLESDDEDGEFPRRGDPNWVPRPRNPFIIFRCEYSKTNSRDAAEARGIAVPAHHEKSLSKRAGEAWSKLTPAERKPFDDRAKLEKEAHLREFPDYKFRPQKKPRVPMKARPSTKSKSPARRPLSSRKRSPVGSLASSDKRKSSEAIGGGRRGPARACSPPFPPPPFRDHKYRSPSASALPVTISTIVPSQATAFDVPPPKLKRRSRSLTQFTAWSGGVPSLDVQSASRAPYFQQEETASSLSARIHDPQYGRLSNANAVHISPFSAVSYSLSGWNSEPPQKETSPPSSIGTYSESFPASPASSYQSPVVQSTAQFSPSANTYDPQTNMPQDLHIDAVDPDVMWSTPELSSTEYFQIPGQPLYEAGTVDQEHANALQEFDYGLIQHAPYGLFPEASGDIWGNTGVVLLDGEDRFQVPPPAFQYH